MSTEELEKALERQRLGFVEQDMIELLARMFDADEALVARVVYASWYACTQTAIFDTIAAARLRIPANVIDAIKKATDAGISRLVLARAIQASQTVTVPVDALIPMEALLAGAICEGCSERIECMADNLHTPNECTRARKAHLQVFPLRMTRETVDVEAAQPRGTFTIPIMKLKLTKVNP